MLLADQADICSGEPQGREALETQATIPADCRPTLLWGSEQAGGTHLWGMRSSCCRRLDLGTHATLLLSLSLISLPLAISCYP